MINSDLIQTLIIDRPNLKMNNSEKKLTTELYYFHVSVGWTLAINFDILIVKTSKNTKMQIFLMLERLDQKLPKGG